MIGKRKNLLEDENTDFSSSVHNFSSHNSGESDETFSELKEKEQIGKLHLSI